MDSVRGRNIYKGITQYPENACFFIKLHDPVFYLDNTWKRSGLG
jgi:hypothetical protein